MNWRKVGVVALFEWNGSVRRPGYWIATLAFPLVLVGYVELARSLSGTSGRGVPAPFGLGMMSGAALLAGPQRVAFSVGFSLLYVIPITLSGGHLPHATGAEKESRVGEVLLSAARADELLTGKLIGLGAAALFQVALWIGLALASAYGTGITLVRDTTGVPAIHIALAMLGFGLGYLFIGTMLLAVASMAGNAREVQQFGGLCIALVIFPFFLGMRTLLVTPHGALGHALSWFPFTAPMILALRLTLAPDGISWLELAGALVFLMVATVAVLRVGARLYRIGLVSAGGELGVRALLRQARLAIDAAPPPRRSGIP